ncbi:MAG TPA: AMP-binding protein, partial [Acetobacteraceae bacterium]|nr:AMP-binding protein [Acetobacteraceae bacterium]
MTKYRFPSVAAAFAASAARGPGRVFLHVLPETAAAYGIAAGDITYGAAAEAIARLRDAYANAGYGRGHRVGLMLENRPAFFLHWFALNGLGISVVPLSTELRPAERDYLVGHSEIALAVLARGLRPDLACPTMEEGAPPPPAPTRRDASPPPDEATECGLLYTSGTTGRPKGCVLSNR